VKEFSASTIEFITWCFLEGDYDRARRRALLNQIYNGASPYTEKETSENNIVINVNTLTGVRELHNARAQFSAALTKPGVFFQCRTDAGAKHKRTGYGTTVTNLIGKTMKRNLGYFEMKRSKIAQNVLHGIAPSTFEDSDCWAPRPLPVEDVYVPSNTLLYDIATDKVPFFALRRSFKAPELIKLAKAPKPDPGWNQELVDACLKWIDEQTLSMAGDQFTDYLSPEKFEERLKGDGTFYSGDRAPVINVWDFYYRQDDAKVRGWNRKMILDPWNMPNATGVMVNRRSDGPYSKKEQFLFNPGNRIYASCLRELVCWDFADLSAVFPANYHTVRSLGWLLYSMCHLDNRLFSKVMESIFEQLMVLMRIKSQDDMQRALSVNLVNRGFVDDSIDFIKAQDRYQVNAQLAQMGLTEIANLISRNSSSFTAKTPSTGAGDMKVPTATQWLGEEAKVTQLVSAGLALAYEYERPQFYEIFRRFTKKYSTDPEVQMVQAKCLKDGVPEKVLYNLASWDIEPERIMGGGNKTIEMAIAQQLMQYRNQYDPAAQRRILHKVTLAITDDAAEADALVPETPQVSSSVHDAQLAVGTLLIGQPMEIRENVSHVEYAQALIDALGVEVSKVNAMGGVTDQAHLMGMQNLAGQTVEGAPIPGNGCLSHIQLVAQDEQQRDVAKILNDQLGKMMNEVRAFAQRLAEQQQQAAQQNGGLDPETMSKIQANLITAQTKSENTKTAHAQRTAQRQIAWELEEKRKDEQTAAEIQRENARLAQELRSDAVKTVSELENKKSEDSKKKSPD
jgi:hypothetical protein